MLRIIDKQRSETKGKGLIWSNFMYRRRNLNRVHNIIILKKMPLHRFESLFRTVLFERYGNSAFPCRFRLFNMPYFFIEIAPWNQHFFRENEIW